MNKVNRRFLLFSLKANASLCSIFYQIFVGCIVLLNKLDIFHTVIKTCLDCFFPCRTVKLHDNDKPWVAANFQKIIEKRQRAFREGQGSQFRRLRNLANRESKRLKATYLKRKLDELQLYPNAIKQLVGYPKNKILSNFVVDNQVLTGKHLAQKINDVFVSFTQDIRPLNMSSQSVVPTENSTFSTQSQFIIDEKDVCNKLSTIPTNKSPGPDGIPNWVLKSYAYILSSPVASIFNASFDNACVIKPGSLYAEYDGRFE